MDMFFAEPSTFDWLKKKENSLLEQGNLQFDVPISHTALNQDDSL